MAQSTTAQLMQDRAHMMGGFFPAFLNAATTSSVNEPIKQTTIEMSQLKDISRSRERLLDYDTSGSSMTSTTATKTNRFRLRRAPRKKYAESDSAISSSLVKRKKLKHKKLTRKNLKKHMRSKVPSKNECRTLEYRYPGSCNKKRGKILTDWAVPLHKPSLRRGKYLTAKSTKRLLGRLAAYAIKKYHESKLDASLLVTLRVVAKIVLHVTAHVVGKRSKQTAKDLEVTDFHRETAMVLRHLPDSDDPERDLKMLLNLTGIKVRNELLRLIELD